MCTVSSGGSGGLFGPSIFIGGMLGGTIGTIGQSYFPEVVQQSAAYMVVGMAAFFGAVANPYTGAQVVVHAGGALAGFNNWVCVDKRNACRCL